jgi:hypothetical protein
MRPGQSLAIVMTVRDRVIVPLPHVFVHADHALHDDTWHEHGACVHGCESMSAPHGAPLPTGCWKMTRVRVCAPVPHVCEHALQVDHPPIWQSKLHADRAHVSISLSGGHGGPLHCGSVAILRPRVRVPLPHVTEHIDHCDQVSVTHETGQQPSAQLVVSFSEGHGSPPSAGATVTVRWRSLLADVPHVAEHSDHADQRDTRQSTGGGGHVGCEHFWVSLAVPAQLPPHDAGVSTDRDRDCMPSPHVTVQPDQAVNGDHTQLLGQQPPFAVQAWLSMSTSQVPPQVSGINLERVRDCVPRPHVTEQDDHADHAERMQLEAQQVPPHMPDSINGAGQSAPPHDCCMVTERLRRRVPVPHVCEHALHCDQSLTEQSCGQQPVLHACESLICDDEHVPPHDSGVIERVRVCEPPPHVVEHALHADHAPITQLTGQQPVLQDCICDVCDSLHEPPHVAGLMVRERVLLPPPHIAEHVDQLDHAPTTQLAGQHAGVHGCDSIRFDCSGQTPPFLAGDVMVRVRVAVPVPQVTEQDHVVHCDTTQFTGHAFVLHARV